jgi:hypothetical protein
MALDVTHPFSEPHVLSLGAILIDRRIEQYRRLGCSRELMLQEMLAAGLPLDTLKARFPEFPDSRFRRPENTPSHISPRPATMPPPSVANPTVDHANHPTVIGQVTAAEGISFQYLPLIQCSFPHTDPKQAATFSRKNGWLELTLGTTNPEVGLPYGVPARLLTIYCTSEAVRTNSSEIYLGDSVHDFLRRLDVPITRGARGSLSVYANQILRLIHSTVSIDENIRDGAGRSGLHIRLALFVEEARLWWDDPDHAKNESRAGQGAIGNGSSLIFSSVLFHSILERSAPLAHTPSSACAKVPWTWTSTPGWCIAYFLSANPAWCCGRSCRRNSATAPVSNAPFAASSWTRSSACWSSIPKQNSK